MTISVSDLRQAKRDTTLQPTYGLKKCEKFLTGRASLIKDWITQYQLK